MKPRLLLVAFTLIFCPFTPIFACALLAGSNTVRRAPAFSTETMAVEKAEAYTLVLFPFTITCTFGVSGGGAVVVDVVVGVGAVVVTGGIVDVGVGAVVVVTTGGTEDVVGVIAGAGVEDVEVVDGWLTGLGAGTVVGAGVVAATGSRYQAAQKPSLPPGSRT